MYALISKNEQAILVAIDPQKDVQKYESLVSKIDEASNPQYQDEYKNFWQIIDWLIYGFVRLADKGKIAW